MDADARLVATNPRLVADHHFGGAGSPPSRGPRRRGAALVALLIGVVGVLAGAAIYRAMASRGTLRIKTRPAGATVDIEGMTATTEYPEDAKQHLDGMEVTWSRPLTVHRKPGRYDVSVSCDGYESRVAQVVVQAGQTASLDLELAAITDMHLEIASRPTGRIVNVDARPLMTGSDHEQFARTDLNVYTLGAGRHWVEIDGDCRYQPWKREVELHPGAITRLEATLQPWPFKPRGCTDAEWRAGNGSTPRSSP